MFCIKKHVLKSTFTL